MATLFANANVALHRQQVKEVVQEQKGMAITICWCCVSGRKPTTTNQSRRLRARQDEQEKFQIKRNVKLDVRAHVGRGISRALETKKVCAAQRKNVFGRFYVDNAWNVAQQEETSVIWACTKKGGVSWSWRWSAPHCVLAGWRKQTE